MARRPRLHVPGGFYHVTLRGNHQRPVFFRDSDRDLLDRIVADSLVQQQARLHAYCWMSNHLHLLVQVSNVPLGRLILRIASAYARTVQLRIATTGHLFQRRHHALLVDSDRYLLTLVQYIHLNPVRAGMVSDPADYPWSSHRVYLGLSNQPWITTSMAMQVLSPTPVNALENYRRLMCSAEPPCWGVGTLVPNREQPQVLGDDAFVARMTGAEPGAHPRCRLDELVAECSTQFQVSAESLVSPIRSRLLTRARAWLGHQSVNRGIASVCSVARLLGRTEGAIRQAMNRYPVVSGSMPIDDG